MATGIILTVAEKLYAVLSSEELRKVYSMFGYESQLDDLKLTVSTIKCVLLDAESKHQELSHEGRDYIERLKETVYDVDDLLDDFNTMVQKHKHMKGGKFSKKVRRFFSRSNYFLVAYNVSHEIKSLRSKLDKIAKDRQQFGLSDVYVPIRRKQETMSFVGEDSIIGRETDKEAIVEMLLGELESSNDVGRKVSYVNIVGIGGLGKTALAQLVYNDNRVEKAFELRLWVCVSNDFALENIFRQMLAKDAFNMEDLQTQVRKLIKGKRYLLVLDDVWSESRDEWDNLKSFLDLGSAGSRVVVTSRSKKVARVVGDDLIYELKGLSEENSWNLFKRLAFQQGKEPMCSTDHLFDIGKAIVRKCANVPLAIRVVGSMLYDQDESKWLSFKNYNLMEMGLGRTDVMSVLKYSYYHLPPVLKSCFSYCAFFPKDYYIEKELLIRLWMAHGCLDESRGSGSKEDVGEEYFSILLHRCFLQGSNRDRHGESRYYSMHDLIHDLAQEVAGRETQVLHSTNDQFDKRSRHLSFTKDAHSLLTSLTQLSEMKKLRTFLTLSGGKYQDSFEPNVLAICSHLKQLRVLDLHNFLLNTLPDTVGNLSHLRYLDLSGNRGLTVLPNSITKLYNLELLNLDRTRVRELPLNMRKLVNLRHLSFRNCNCLTHMPPGLDNLTSLRTLTSFVVGKEDSNHGNNIGKLRYLSALINLRGDLKIIFNNNFSCDEANYRQVELLRTAHLKKLSIQFSDQGAAMHGNLLACLWPHSGLEKIRIESYKALSLPCWAESLTSSLPNLVEIHLVKFDCLEILPSLSKLRHLKFLELVGMPNVEFMDNDVVMGPLVDELLFFFSLEELIVSNFPRLKGWWKEEISGVTNKVGSSSTVFPSFPSLRDLTLNNCPNLTTLPSCPNLCNVNLYRCHEALTLFRGERVVSGHPTITSPSSNLLYMDKVTTDNIGAFDCLFDKSLGGILDLMIQNFVGVSFSPLAKLELKCLTSLQSLTISDCGNLEALPEWILYLTSLETLNIWSCNKLKLLPEAIAHIPALNTLYIRDCEFLMERCREPDGEDWLKIRDIPHVRLDDCSRLLSGATATFTFA